MEHTRTKKKRGMTIMVAWSPKQLKYILLLVLDSPNHRRGQQHHGNHAKWPQYQPNPDQANITKQNVVSTWHLSEEKKTWVCKLKNTKLELPYNLHPRHLDPINSCPSSLWEELCEGLLSNRKESESRTKIALLKKKEARLCNKDPSRDFQNDLLTQKGYLHPL